MDVKPFIFGGIASVTAELGTFPLDLTKTRLQVQGQTIDSKFTTVKYKGMLHAFRTIVMEEGMRGLYAGFSPAAFRQATYGTVKIGIYTGMKRHYIAKYNEETLLVNVWCGLVSGVISQSIFNPADVLKVRMQVERRSNSNRKGLFQSFIEIYRNEGFSGLYRGVVPTACRAAIAVGSELPAYDITKKHLLTDAGFKDNVITHFLSSVVAGFAGAVASTPFDTIKSRLMSQRKMLNKLKGLPKESIIISSSPKPGTKHSAQIYRSAWHCLYRTICDEGPLALWKGFIPTWTRLGPWNVFFFITLEQLYRLYQ